MANKKEITAEEVELYTNLTFLTEDVTIHIRNINLSMLDLFSDKNKIISELMYYFWFMHGVYDEVQIMGIDFIILARTKKKIELMVKR